MHGRRQKDRDREAAEPDEARQARVAKMRKLRGMLETGLQCRRARDHSAQSLELAARLLTINPSISTLWSLRRDALLAQVEAIPEDERLAAREAAVRAELELNAQALRKGNVKSHEAWTHRAWVVAELGLGGRAVDLAGELELCKQLLSSDERNFHCYQYRAKLAELAGHSAADDLRFAEALVERNFSNYSAWHLKTKALEALERHRPLSPERLAREFDEVNNALFTEPDDQSGWMFQRWLVQRLRPRGLSPPEDAALLSLLREQLALMDELDEAEEHRSKWALLAQLRLGEAERKFCPGAAPASQLAVCARLRELDPTHAGYYAHLERALRASS